MEVSIGYIGGRYDYWSSHACYLTSSGGVKCVGYNRYGQLGIGTTTDTTTPTDVSGLTSNVKDITTGGLFFSCAVTNNGGIKCWGRNDYGQLGIGTNEGPQKCLNARSEINYSSCSTSPVDVVGF